jgi:lysozyme family protein
VNDPQESVIRTVIGQVLEREGGVADVGDGKGTTRRGQTPGWLAQWRMPIPQSADDAAMNYRSWLEQTDLDALCTEDDALPDAVIDFAIHSGERVAIAALQRALRVTADGVIGPVTMTALVTCDRPHVAAQVVADRLRYLGGLLADPRRAIWAKGWLVRVAAQVESLA